MSEIEKVIKQLETVINQMNSILNGSGGFSITYVKDTSQEAIQTIRELQSQSEEVCEWKYEQVIEYASSECGGFDTHRIYFNTFKYCPYCGRKIKVVK